MRRVEPIIWVALLLVGMLAGPAAGDVILSTDFTGRIVNGKTASNITWSTLGLQDPGDLTWVVEGSGPTDTGLFDTANAQGYFAPDMNIDNEGPWSVTIPLTLTTPQISLADVVIDWQHFNNSGSFQSVNRAADWTVSVTGSSSGLLDSVTALGVNGTSGTLPLTFSSPLILTNTETYGVKIYVIGSQTNGNNTSLNAVTLDGQIVPEPGSLALIGLGVLGLLRRRKRA